MGTRQPENTRSFALAAHGGAGLLQVLEPVIQRRVGNKLGHYDSDVSRLNSAPRVASSSPGSTS